MEQKQPHIFSEETSSIWRDTVHLPTFKPLKNHVNTDVLIVGAGITGITAAYMLANEGVKVTLIDAGQIASGTSGYTTAKITAQHSLIYDQLVANLGFEKAGLYYQANNEASEWIRNQIKAQTIECDYEIQPAIVYAMNDSEAKKIEKEKIAYDRLGIKGTLTDSIDLPFAVKNALVMPDQAQFHPLMYLHALIADLVKMNVPIYEETMAVAIKEDPDPLVTTKQGFSIRCRKVLICSHFPFYDNRFYFARMFPERSYLIACETEKQFSGGMYLSAGDPKRSIRSLRLNHKNYLLIGGENHKTGRGERMEAHYSRLESFARQNFGDLSIAAHWSAQDFTTLDQVPYIGRLTKNSSNLFVAAGFRKWGMTTGTLAAKLLTDLAMERSNPYTEVFSPSRFEAGPMLANFLIENIGVAGQLAKGKLIRPKPLDEHLQNDQGMIGSLHGRRVGAYRDKDGKLTVVDATCPHLGCEVNWNQGERTWDCPCHGSRFEANGKVIDGPAQKPLSTIFSESEHQDAEHKMSN